MRNGRTVLGTQCGLHEHILQSSTRPGNSLELTGVTVIDVLITGGAAVPPMAGAAETPRQVGASPVGATGRGASTFIHILLASWAWGWGER